MIVLVGRQLDSIEFHVTLIVESGIIDRWNLFHLRKILHKLWGIFHRNRPHGQRIKKGNYRVTGYRLQQLLSNFCLTDAVYHTLIVSSILPVTTREHEQQDS